MKEFGGYFELELNKGKEIYHTTPYLLKSGRASLTFIFENIKPTNIYVPYYTCDALLEPIIKAKINYTFYAINDKLEINVLPVLKPGEIMIYINYFDIKRKYVNYLSDIYKDRLIVDCTQAYFLKGNNSSWYFNSTRKFFGVPDGSDLYVPDGYTLTEKYQQLANNTQFITQHLIDRFNGDTQHGYEYFKQNEVLNGGDVYAASKLTQYLSSHINYKDAITKRKKNFDYLHKRLKQSNQLNIGNLTGVPMLYPYLPYNFIEKKELWRKNIFVPILWDDCINRENAADYPFEKKLSNLLIPIPVDHRYNITDMDYILNYLENL